MTSDPAPTSFHFRWNLVLRDPICCVTPLMTLCGFAVDDRILRMGKYDGDEEY